MNPDELCRALHLASPALPIGSFSYSQGLETAVELGIIRTEEDALKWIADGLTEIVGRCDAPVVAFIYRACQAQPLADSLAQITDWNSWFALNWIPPTSPAHPPDPIAFPTAFALSAAALKLSETTTLTAFCFSWLETQVAAAMKLVPLGQAAGQRILTHCRSHVADVVISAANIPPDAISSWAPMLGIFSARHESQYSRLFRS
jgi:urease accessory protein